VDQRVERERVAVIGAGSWGTALANHLAERGHPVTLWARDEQLAGRLESERENAPYLPGVVLQARVTPTHDIGAVAHGAGVFISALPSHAVRAVWRLMAPVLPEAATLVSATKGIEAGSLRTMSRVLQDILPADDHPIDVAVLSGPSFAHEVGSGAPTAVVAAARDRRIAEAVQRMFSTPAFRVYTSTDVIGVELGGALKNVMALAAGVCDGLNLGANTRAALITRSLAEMTQLGVAMGARAQTFAGLSGLGDLILTCTGERSRNHSVGVQLGQGKKLPAILSRMRMVAEGVTTAGCVTALAGRHGVEMPIAEKVHALLQGHISPRDAVMELMTRTLKHEEPMP
jgi:glycerol-3-phosphate dehydrogenase (NAD(P)+)